MNRRIAAVLVAVSVLAGVGVGYAVQRSTDQPAAASDRPTGTPSTTATPSADAELIQEARADRVGPSWSPADPIGSNGEPLVIGDVVPGGIEPVSTDMTIQQAIATELVERDTDREEICDGTHYRWVGQLSEGLDLQVDDAKRVVSIGMSKDAAETATGISIGNSYGMLKKAYGSKLSDLEEMDYGQTGAFVRDGNAWIGFMFAEAPDQMGDSSRITFIEVTSNNRPGLVRDGC